VGSEALTVVDTKTVVSWGVCSTQSIKPVAYSFDQEPEAAFLSKVVNCSRLYKVHHIAADLSFTVYELVAGKFCFRKQHKPMSYIMLDGS
jgi:hypothetical protein